MRHETATYQCPGVLDLRLVSLLLLEEQKLTDPVFDAAKSGRRGILGIQPTLSALTEEKVQTLLIANKFSIDVRVRTRCDYLSGGRFEFARSAAARAEVRDLTDRAIEKAILIGAEADVVSAVDARERLLAEGGLAALVRY